MKLQFRTLQEDSFYIEADAVDTMPTLKNKIKLDQGYPIDSQTILFKGQVVADDATVASLKMQDGDFLFFLPLQVKIAATTTTTVETTTTITSTTTKILDEPPLVTSPLTTSPPQSPPATPGEQTRKTSSYSFVKRSLSKVVDQTSNQFVVKKSLQVAEFVTPQIVAEAVKTVPDYLRHSDSSEDGMNVPSKSSSSAVLAAALLASSQAVDLLSKAGTKASYYAIQRFYDELSSEQGEGLRKAEIVELYRRVVPKGVMHEYIMLKTVSAGGGRPDEAPRWIRIDRNFDRLDGPSLSNLTGVFKSLDFLCMSEDETHELMAGNSIVKARVEFKDARPTVLNLANLLRIMERESKDYKFLSENCWFFTSVIQEMLTDFFGGATIEGSIGREKLGPEVRKKVKWDFAKSKNLTNLLAA